MDNSSVSTFEIENFLNRRLGEKEAEEIMEYINAEIDARVEARTAEVRNEITTWRNDLKKDFATKEDAAALQQKLVKRVSAVEGTIILWGFVFWLTIILAVYIIFKFVL